MALDLSKLRNNVQAPETNTAQSGNVFSRLNLNGMKKQATQETTTAATALNGLNTSQITATRPEPINPGFKLSFTDGKSYDLDEIIANKRMDNANAPLFLQAGLGQVFEETMSELVAKKILSDYNIPYSDSNYKTQINLVPNFDRIFTVYSNKYYRIYVGMETFTYSVTNSDKFDSIVGMKYYPIVDGSIQVTAEPLTVKESDRSSLIGTKIALKNEEYEGSISLETVFQQASVTSADVKKYTLTDVYEADRQGKFLSYTDRYRPILLWTEGTPDPGLDIGGSGSATDVDSDNLAYWVSTILKTNSALSIAKNAEGWVYIDIDYQKLAQEYSAGSAEYFKQISEIAAINSELANIKATLEDLSSIIGEDILATNLKVSYSKDLFDARPMEKETNYLNLEIPFDISADEFMYYGSTLYSLSIQENGSKALILENPRDYTVAALSNGTKGMTFKRDDVLLGYVLANGSYGVDIPKGTTTDLENGCKALTAQALSLE